MMRKFNFLLLFILNLFLLSCGSNQKNKKSDFSLDLKSDNAEFKLNDLLEASVLNTENHQIDSVSFYFNKTALNMGGPETKIAYSLKEAPLGNQELKVLVYYNATTDTLKKAIKIYNNVPPSSYTYEIINTYPHDIASYTQGLEFHNGILYESIGQYEKSKLRKLDLETGEVLKEIKLDDQYFAEGLTILNGKIYQLTWQAGEGFIYDLENFEKTGSFGYNQSKEGWGLCNNGSEIFKSDGTEKIWILNPKTLAEEDFIQTVTHRTIASKLNELEWVNGKIYANTYQKNGVAIINPENGAIEGLIDFSELKTKVTQHDDLDVLNGIAYNSQTNTLFITGKNWDKIFEVKVSKK